MNCIRCKSHRTMKFVDGYNQRRVFCRNCGRSFLETTPGKVPHSDQKNIMGFNAGVYYRPGVIPFR